jgi:hypothetical protein
MMLGCVSGRRGNRREAKPFEPPAIIPSLIVLSKRESADGASPPETLRRRSILSRSSREVARASTFSEGRSPSLPFLRGTSGLFLLGFG